MSTNYIIKVFLSLQHEIEKEKIKGVLRDKSSSHSEILKNNYNALIKKMVVFLQKAIDGFEEPFIIKVIYFNVVIIEYWINSKFCEWVFTHDLAGEAI